MKNKGTGFLVIPNWDRYQHHHTLRKDGWRATWIKLDIRSCDDHAYTCLSLADRGLLAELWKIAGRTQNLIPDDPKWITRAAQIVESPTLVKRSLERLVTSGWVILSREKQQSNSRDEERRGDVVSTSNEVLTPAKPRARKRDGLWDTLTEVLGTSPATRSERGRWNSALKELREAGATPETLRERAGLYRRRWPDVSLTATALSAHWGSLVPEARELTVEERREAHLASLRERGLVP